MSDSTKILDNWLMFRREWEDYEIASELIGKDEKIRVATLRILMGRDCARIVDNLGLSTDKRKKVDQIITALNTYFEPERNVIFERSVFNAANQLVGESINQYVDKLRQLASTCDYTPSRVHDEAIRDRLVLGIIDKEVRKILIRNRKLTLSEAIETCRSSEQLNSEIGKLDLEKNTESVYIINEKPRNGKKYIKRCKFCGKTHEWNKDKCPAYGKVCEKCNRPNHFAQVCFKRQIHAATESYSSLGSDCAEEL